MIVIIGLAVLLVAVIIGMVGVLSNAGAAHPSTDNFSVFAANRGKEARREFAQSGRETAFLNRDLAILHDHQSTGTGVGPTTNAERHTSCAGGQTRRTRDRLSRRWSHLRRPVAGFRRDATG